MAFPRERYGVFPSFYSQSMTFAKGANFPISQRLFAENYSISLTSSNPQRAAGILQETLNSAWAFKRGFHLSGFKTIMVIFQKRFLRSTSLLPLLLQNILINLQSSARFLGLIFSHNVSWTPHIKSLKAQWYQCHQHPETPISPPCGL